MATPKSGSGCSRASGGSPRFPPYYDRLVVINLDKDGQKEDVFEVYPTVAFMDLSPIDIKAVELTPQDRRTVVELPRGKRGVIFAKAEFGMEDEPIEDGLMKLNLCYKQLMKRRFPPHKAVATMVHEWPGHFRSLHVYGKYSDGVQTFSPGAYPKMAYTDSEHEQKSRKTNKLIEGSSTASFLQRAGVNKAKSAQMASKEQDIIDKLQLPEEARFTIPDEIQEEFGRLPENLSFGSSGLQAEDAAGPGLLDTPEKGEPAKDEGLKTPINVTPYPAASEGRKKRSLKQSMSGKGKTTTGNKEDTKDQKLAEKDECATPKMPRSLVTKRPPKRFGGNAQKKMRIEDLEEDEDADDEGSLGGAESNEFDDSSDFKKLGDDDIGQKLDKESRELDAQLDAAIEYIEAEKAGLVPPSRLGLATFQAKGQSSHSKDSAYGSASRKPPTDSVKSVFDPSQPLPQMKYAKTKPAGNPVKVDRQLGPDSAASLVPDSVESMIGPSQQPDRPVTKFGKKKPSALKVTADNEENVPPAIEGDEDDDKTPPLPNNEFDFDLNLQLSPEPEPCKLKRTKGLMPQNHPPEVLMELQLDNNGETVLSYPNNSAKGNIEYHSGIVPIKPCTAVHNNGKLTRQRSYSADPLPTTSEANKEAEAEEDDLSGGTVFYPPADPRHPFQQLLKVVEKGFSSMKLSLDRMSLANLKNHRLAQSKLDELSIQNLTITDTVSLQAGYNILQSKLMIEQHIPFNSRKQIQTVFQNKELLICLAGRIVAVSYSGAFYPSDLISMLFTSAFVRYSSWPSPGNKIGKFPVPNYLASLVNEIAERRGTYEDPAKFDMKEFKKAMGVRFTGIKTSYPKYAKKDRRRPNEPDEHEDSGGEWTKYDEGILDYSDFISITKTGRLVALPNFKDDVVPLSGAHPALGGGPARAPAPTASKASTTSVASAYSVGSTASPASATSDSPQGDIATPNPDWSKKGKKAPVKKVKRPAPYKKPKGPRVQYDSDEY